MAQHSPTIAALIRHFSSLPGIGAKTAERFVFALLKKRPEDVAAFAEALQLLHSSISTCARCFTFAESSPCQICRNPGRSNGVICVVARPQDVVAIEKTRQFTGLYHVLGGSIDPLEGIGADQLTVPQLLSRLTADTVTEVILALNPDMQGEATMLYLTNLIKAQGVAVSRLARGLPTGGDVEYADEATLSNALQARQKL